MTLPYKKLERGDFIRGEPVVATEFLVGEVVKFTVGLPDGNTTVENWFGQNRAGYYPISICETLDILQDRFQYSSIVEFNVIGTIIGNGLLDYGRKKPSFRLEEIVFFDRDGTGFVDEWDYLVSIHQDTGILLPPVVYSGLFNECFIEKGCQGPTKVCHPEMCKSAFKSRAGVVIRNQGMKRCKRKKVMNPACKIYDDTGN